MTQELNNKMDEDNMQKAIALCMCVPKNGVPLAKLSIAAYVKYIKYPIKLYFTVNDLKDEKELEKLYPKSTVTFVAPNIIASNFRGSIFHSKLVNILWRQVHEGVCIISDFDCIPMSNKLTDLVDDVIAEKFISIGSPYTKQQVFIKDHDYSGYAYKRQDVPNLIFSIINKKKILLEAICDLELFDAEKPEAQFTYIKDGKLYVRDTGDLLYAWLQDTESAIRTLNRKGKRYSLIKTSWREYFFENISSPEEYLDQGEVILVHLKKFSQKLGHIEPIHYLKKLGIDV